jgi:hypothetical protein
MTPLTYKKSTAGDCHQINKLKRFKGKPIRSKHKPLMLQQAHFFDLTYQNLLRIHLY